MITAEIARTIATSNIYLNIVKKLLPVLNEYVVTQSIASKLILNINNTDSIPSKYRLSTLESLIGHKLTSDSIAFKILQEELKSLGYRCYQSSITKDTIIVAWS